MSPPRRHLLLALSAAAVGLVVALLLLPERPADDAAITLRYAERLGTGLGWGYNDHERVLGSSSGLWMLVLAALRAIGVPVVGAALGLSAVLYAVTVGLATRLATHLGGTLAGLVAAAILLTSGSFRVLLSGLESGLATALGTAAILVLVGSDCDPDGDGSRAVGITPRRELVVGALVGLALVNKLDAVWLLAAVAGAVWIATRRAPVRLVGVALAVLAPYLLACTVWFGSPIPQSATAKLGGRADAAGWSWDPTWAVVALRGLWPLVPAIALGAWCWARPEPLVDRAGGGRPEGEPPDAGRRAAALALLGWALLHGAAVSLVPAGGEYPWYLAVLHVPAAVLGAAGAAGLWSRRPWAGAARRVAAVVVLAGVALTVVYPVATSWPDAGPTESEDLFDRQLPAVVDWLEPRLGDDDVLRTCLGAPALAFPTVAVDDPCELTTRTSPGPAAFEVLDLSPRVDADGRETWAPPEGRCVAMVPSPRSAHPEGRRFVVLRPGPATPDGLCPEDG